VRLALVAADALGDATGATLSTVAAESTASVESTVSVGMLGVADVDMRTSYRAYSAAILRPDLPSLFLRISVTPVMTL